MTVLTYQEVYSLARGAGLNPAAAAIATAIAKGESGFNTEAVGDVGLSDPVKWGPSIGLWQIRSLRAETGKGTTRDANRLKDPTFNAKSMATLSGMGAKWRDWSVYNHGTYKAYLTPATAAGAAVEKDPGLLDKIRAAIQVGGMVGTATVKEPGAVLSAAGSSLGDAVSGAVSGLNPFGGWQSDAQSIAIKSLFVLVGGGLFVAGAIRLVIPATVNAVRDGTGI